MNQLERDMRALELLKGVTGRNREIMGYAGEVTNRQAERIEMVMLTSETYGVVTNRVETVNSRYIEVIPFE